MADIKKIVEDSFTRYAGNVILNRAICDARDMLKPSVRMLMYSQLAVTKNIPSKPFIKSARVVGDALGHYYEHGDNSCYCTYMRLSKPFAMRYPLEDCQGNNGTLNNTNDEASMRYTELRLSPLGYALFGDVEKETISEWSENFDETEKYPKVSPTKGYYNICNGTVGLGIAISSSIPQFNLREINESLIKLLWNPEIPFDEICVMPDYATGATLLNANDVKESLRNGTGSAAKLRSVIEYDKSRRVLVVKELPYGVYTETISEQIQKLLEKDPNCGIENVNDASHKKPDYEIYLTKNANPEKVLRQLYRETSLENFCGINMTVLVDGKKPAILGLKELLQCHLDHEKAIYINGFSFDLRKINARLHIIEGLIKAISMIDEVVKTIKSCADAKNASIGLQHLLSIDEAQAKAILELKLSRLTHLDITKLENEKTSLESEKNRIVAILSDENLLKKEIEKGLREVANKFGDGRRTKIMNLEFNGDEEPIEVSQLQVSLTNKNTFVVTETSTLCTQKRGSVGAKLKLDADEYVISSKIVDSDETLLLFSTQGRVYTYKASELTPNEKNYISLDTEKICAFNSTKKTNSEKHIIFATARGIIKKSLLSDYINTKKGGATAIKLDEGDKIVSVIFVNDENIGLLTKQSNFLMIKTTDIRPIGKVARGIKGIELREGDEVVSVRTIPQTTKWLASISANGQIKKTKIGEFVIHGRATRGAKIQALDVKDLTVDFLPIGDEKEITVAATRSTLRLSVNEVSELSRAANGVRAIKLRETDKAVGFSW